MPTPQLARFLKLAYLGAAILFVVLILRLLNWL